MNSKAENGNLLISEVLIDSEEGEFIEIYNPTQKDISLANYFFAYFSSSKEEWSNPYRVRQFSSEDYLEAKGYYTIGLGWTSEDFEVDWLAYDSNQLSNKAGTIAIFKGFVAEENLIDAVAWGEVSLKKGSSLKVPDRYFSLERKWCNCEIIDRGDNGEDFFIQENPNPRSREEKSFCEELSENEEGEEGEEDEEGEPKESNDGEEIDFSDIRINEILPNSEKGREEFIELYNSGEKDINLAGCELKDNSSSSYIFGESFFIEAEKFLLLKRGEEFKFAMNNDGDTIIFFCSSDSENYITTVTYEKTKKNYSYNFNDSKWKWSSKLTPGEKNEFDIEEEENLRKEYIETLRINELLPNPKGSDSENEFIEIYNYGSKDIDLNGWIIEDNGKEIVIEDSLILKGNDYLSIYRESVNFSLNNGGNKISILNPNKKVISSVEYKKSEEGAAYAFNGKNWEWTPHSTPGKENLFEEEKIYSHSLRLNEVYPNPSEGKDEYVEIFNFSDSDIDLEGWILKDLSKRKYVFPENSNIKSNGYLVVFGQEFKFALNNSGGEAVYLMDPNEEITSEVYYGKSRKSLSYNFAAEDWRWSRSLTPGRDNKLNSKPNIKLDIDKKIYEGLSADFEAEIVDPDRDNLEIIWDFGDGNKSKGAITTHTYEKKGVYSGEVIVFDGSEEAVEEFKINVKNYPKFKVEIMQIAPNPIGIDSENEWIEVKNNSKKKINLGGWSIATGWDRLSNHPINEKIMIRPGEVARITREHSRFSLNNKKAKIELRYPNGKVADKMKYDLEKGIKEGITYKKVNRKWQWSGFGSISANDKSNKKTLKSKKKSSNKKENNSRKEFEKNNGHGTTVSYIPNKYTPIKESKKDKLYLYGLSEKWEEVVSDLIFDIKSKIRIKERANKFYFIDKTPMEDHYFVAFLEGLKRNLNKLLTNILYF